jgi:hypothetical protein
MTKTDEQGKYFLDGLPLYGTQIIKINTKNDKAQKRGEIFMDTLFGTPLPVGQNENYAFDSAGFKRFSQEAGKRYAIAKNNMWYHVLPGVTVTSIKKTVILRDGAYMNFGYPEDNFTITADDYKYDALRNFLVKKAPGAFYDAENDGIYFAAPGGKQVRPRFIVDKREDVFDRIDYYAIPMSQVISFSIRHVVGPPTFNRTESATGRINLGGDNTDIYLVYLELKPGAYNQDRGKIFTEITGYYPARIFYSPNYENLDASRPDLRTTIHWEPLIKTDENGKATVNFYNADPETKVRIDVQGITDKGIPLVAQTKYDVKN